jgi:hypothetical protein
MAVTELESTEHSTLSWGSVIAGGISAAALSLFLLFLGVGLGLSSVSPWADQGVSATTFKVGAGVYLICVAMISSAVGGYLAGRLRHSWAGVHHDEIYFRDTAHGLVSWAFATVLTAIALGGAVSHIVGGAAGSAGTALTAGAGMAAQSQPSDIYVDTLLRSDPGQANAAAAASPTQLGMGSTGGPAPAANRGGANRAEIGRILAPALTKGGDVSADDKAYLAKVVAARTGLSQADAEKRVNDTIVKAKQATDEARKATASLMLWLAISLLAGAVASMLGATEGGVLRDSKWYEPGWRASTVRNH